MLSDDIAEPQPTEAEVSSPLSVEEALTVDQAADFRLNNYAILHHELDWLQAVINQVICSYLKHDGHEKHWVDIPSPDLSVSDTIYAKVCRSWSLTLFDRLAMALAMAPQLRPEILDIFFGLNERYNRPYTEFGGVCDKSFSGFLPTGQTLNFLICANNPEWRESVSSIFQPSHKLMAEQVVTMQTSDETLPSWSGVLAISSQWLDYFISGIKVRPELSSGFPAHPVTTPLDWQDLVLDDPVMDQVMEVHSWLSYGEQLMSNWNLSSKIKPGYRALFYGPPGTGKSLTASLLAKTTGREIYRVDLSMIVSKYIGETEKNLSRLFDAASYKDWILFFDEADALFGKRTSNHTSNDRHANQQTGYLLQRIEDFPGVVILATNLKVNMEEAFKRRFQSMIHFTMPSSDERLRLWQNAFEGSCSLADDIDLQQIAEQCELAGGAIINVLRFCSLAAISRGSNTVSKAELLEGIKREYRKDNKTFRFS